MTLQTSGPISLGDCNNELGLVGRINLTGPDARELLEVPVGTISLSNAYGKSKHRPTYLITSDTLNIYEDLDRCTVTFTVTTTHVPNGTLMFYILSEGRSANSIDFTALPVGQFYINDNTATFELSAIQDLITEGTEHFTVSIGRTLGQLVATSQFITIGDTSIGVTEPPATTAVPASYYLTSNSTNVNEGGSVTFTVSTTGVDDGTIFTYVLSGGADGSDMSPTGGSITINNNTGIFSVDIIADHLTEGVETFTGKLYLNSVLVATSANITINDTSAAPTTAAPPPPITYSPPPITYSPPTPTPITYAPPPITYSPPPITYAPPPITYAPPPQTTTQAPPTTVLYDVKLSNAPNGENYNLNEGDKLYVTATAKNGYVGTGQLAFVTVNNSPTFMLQDVTNWQQNVINIVGGTGQNSQVTITADMLTEGSESFAVSVFDYLKWQQNGSIAGQPGAYVGTSPVATVNDTSKASVSYTVSLNGATINEGEVLRVTATGGGGGNNGTLAFVTLNNSAGLDLNDLNGWQNNVINIAGGTGTNNQVTITSDMLTEGDEYFQVAVFDYAAWVASGSPAGQPGAYVGTSPYITVKDTSKANVQYSVTVDNYFPNEGSTMIVHANGGGASNYTTLAFVTLYNTSGMGLSDLNGWQNNRISINGGSGYNNSVSFAYDGEWEGGEYFCIGVYDYNAWVANGSQVGVPGPYLGVSDWIKINDNQT